MPAHSNSLSFSAAPSGHLESPSPGKFVSLDNLRQQLVGTNINKQTFLATDYLNHFNEIEMLIEMLPSMPECMEDICIWQPKSYENHFSDSGFSDKALAILAFQHAPDLVRKRFDETIATLDRSIIDTIESLKETFEMDASENLTGLCQNFTTEIRAYINQASAIINGNTDAVITYDMSTRINTERDSIEKTQAAVEELFND